MENEKFPIKDERILIIMQNIFLALDLYDMYLRTISGINFTRREVEIIAFLISGRGVKSIAFSLSVAPKTVETHIHNIMLKLNCNARESIIDFIEKSDKISWLRKHYADLLISFSFNQSLSAVSKLNVEKQLSCKILSEKEKGKFPSLCHQIESCLKKCGFKTSLENPENSYSIKRISLDPHSHDFFIYVLPKTLSLLLEQPSLLPSHILFLVSDKESQMELLKNLPTANFINLLEQENYYLTLFELLKKLLPHINLQPIFETFKAQYDFTQVATPSQRSQVFPKTNNLREEKINYHPQVKYRFRWGKWNTIFSILFIGICSFAGLFVTQGNLILFIKKQDYDLNGLSIRSDLLLPTETTFLKRSELITEINNGFKGKEGIKTVAIVGMGGSGKTTLARYYAHQQKENVVWEINAETKGTLIGSFEKLAQALLKTEEDQKILRNIQNIKDSVNRKEKIVFFVKERLKLQKNWFLIYDNVENFSDLQKYFPQDVNTWGEGKIIITTRNNNIQNSSSIKKVLQIGELSKSQKFDLFMQIMNHGETDHRSPAQKEKVINFLEKIPPFPLDISIAAYYLKTTNISYAKYLENLNRSDKNFTEIQENLLKEAGEYTKTRYNIITLSLKELFDTHKDFSDLLLFIILFDSQNIPRDLLDHYKDNAIVDNFIYHLKKYSIIMTNAPPTPSASPTLSIHRSTQAISLAHLIKTLNLENNHHYMDRIGHTVKSYMEDLVEKEDLLKIKSFIGHCEVFLSHDNLLPNIIRGVISGELGYLYYLVSRSNKVEESLKKSISILSAHKQEYSFLFRPLSYLGICYWGIGDFKEAKKLLIESIEIYKNSNVVDDAGICRALTYLGILYDNQDHLKDAQRVLEESLLIYTKTRSKNYHGLAFTLTHLGNVYRKLGSYKKAKIYLEKSLTVYQQQELGIKPSFGWALANLGHLYRTFGDYETAKNLHEQTHAIYKQHYSQDSLNFAWTLRNLGAAYNEQGDFKKAQIFLEQSFMIFKKVLGENNIKTKWILFELGKLYKNVGAFEKAKTIFEDCLLAYKKNNGSSAFYTGEALMALGELFILENNLDSAENFLNQALNIFQQNKHPNVYMCLEFFSELHLKKSLSTVKKVTSQQSQSFKIQAANDLMQALEIIERYFPENSPHRMRVQLKLKNLEKQHRKNSALTQTI